MISVKILIEAYIEVPDEVMTIERTDEARREDLLQRVGSAIGAGTLKVAQIHHHIVPSIVIPSVKRPTM